MKRSIAALNITIIIILVSVTWMAAVLLFYGCGKKAMPEPPSGRRPPRVTDLSYSISDNAIKLSWTVPKTSAKARSPIAGFFIYRSRQSSIEADCPNCPIHYRRIGELMVRRAAGGQTEPPVVYTETIEPGYRYIYKVVAFDDDGTAGRGSNVVDFTF